MTKYGKDDAATETPGARIDRLIGSLAKTDAPVALTYVGDASGERIDFRFADGKRMTIDTRPEPLPRPTVR